MLAVLSLRGFLAAWRDGGPFVRVLGFLALGQVAYVVLDVPAYHWYYVPAVVGLVLASARGVARAPAVAAAASPRAWTFAAVATLVIVRPWGASDPVPPDARIAAYAAAAVHAAKSAPPGRIAAVEAGAVACASDRPILDLTGLTSPHGEFVTGRRNDDFFAAAPAAVVLHDPPWPQERAIAEDPRFAAAFAPTEFAGGDPRFPLRVWVRR